ncbi:Putative laccase-9 [Linum grandiflorum]
MLSVNGSFPGPTIKVRRGDTAFVNVHNQGSYGLTIHWHGVKQPRNPWSDGPENITQCPIEAGKNFTYEVIFSDEEGTLWWHAHNEWTRATVHGAIIVLPPLASNYPFPTPYADQTLLIASWFKGDVKSIIDEALTTGGDPRASDAFTINGEPGDLYQCSKQTTFRMTVDPGKTYLLRLINAVMNEEHFFGIANHTLTVVGRDGAYTKPLPTPYVMISPGQTMDVLLTTANQTELAQSQYYHYYMVKDGDVPFDKTTTTAVMQYSGIYPPPSTVPFPVLPAYDDSAAAEGFVGKLRSLGSEEHPIKVPKDVGKRLVIAIAVNELDCANASCDGPDGNRLAASMNNVSFVSQSVDILDAYYKKQKGIFNEDFPSEPLNKFNFTGDAQISGKTSRGTKAIMLEYGETVEIVLQGTSLSAAQNHPIHIHGYNVYLVGVGKGNFDVNTHPASSYNLVDPPYVNTIGVPKNGWAAFRFVADNPGVWFMHCHLERHATWGMETVVIVKNGNSADAQIRPRPQHMPLCSSS